MKLVEMRFKGSHMKYLVNIKSIIMTNCSETIGDIYLKIKDQLPSLEYFEEIPDTHHASMFLRY